MSEADPVGLLDTNVFVHALTGDAHADECRRFLAALGEGRVRARLEPLIVHELSYAIGHYRRGVSRQQIAASIVGLVRLQGIVADKPLLVEALERWAATPGLGFADSYLAALATRESCVVFTKNVRHLTTQGATVPDPLPS